MRLALLIAWALLLLMTGDASGLRQGVLLRLLLGLRMPFCSMASAAGEPTVGLNWAILRFKKSVNEEGNAPAQTSRPAAGKRASAAPGPGRFRGRGRRGPRAASCAAASVSLKYRATGMSLEGF
jgi:hypothetical protein